MLIASPKRLAIQPLPIVIITYGCRQLEKSIISLLQSTLVPLNIYIVNNSGKNSEHAFLLRNIQVSYDITLIHSLNLWVLSLNHPHIQALLNANSFYVVTDDDIIYPTLDTGDWLQSFLDSMHQDSSIGKLSLSLRWSSSEELPPPEIPFPMAPSKLIHRSLITKDIYEFAGDTTPALYRTRLFSPNSNFFSPRHQKLVKPNLKCGTSIKYSCISMSNEPCNVYYSKSYASQKAICFGLTAAYLSLDNLRLTPLIPKLFYLIFRPFANLFWLLHLFLAHNIFLFRLLHGSRQ